MEISNSYARPADLRSCGVGSNPALSTKRDVGSAGITVVRPPDQQTWLVRTLVGRAANTEPTALDNGQRSPRKLLRAVVARLLGHKG